jgi:hypothetical protein
MMRRHEAGRLLPGKEAAFLHSPNPRRSELLSLFLNAAVHSDEA